jgi:AcrR family transcriptional regulator
MDGGTEDRIIDAALSLWREGGFSAVTTRAVAARAGVNEVTLFRHFSSKEGLLRAAAGRAAGRSVPDPSRDGASVDLAADLARWARAYLATAVPMGPAILLGVVECRADPELARVCLEVPNHLRRKLEQHLDRLAACGRIRPGPHAEAATLFLASLFAHVITAHLRPGFDWDALADSAGRVFAAALTDPATPAGAPPPPAATGDQGSLRGRDPSSPHRRP